VYPILNGGFIKPSKILFKFRTILKVEYASYWPRKRTIIDDKIMHECNNWMWCSLRHQEKITEVQTQHSDNKNKTKKCLKYYVFHWPPSTAPHKKQIINFLHWDLEHSKDGNDCKQWHFFGYCSNKEFLLYQYEIKSVSWIK